MALAHALCGIAHYNTTDIDSLDTLKALKHSLYYHGVRDKAAQKRTFLSATLCCG